MKVQANSYPTVYLVHSSPREELQIKTYNQSSVFTHTVLHSLYFSVFSQVQHLSASFLRTYSLPKRVTFLIDVREVHSL